MPRIAKEKNEELNNTTAKENKSTKRVAVAKSEKETTKKAKTTAQANVIFHFFFLATSKSTIPRR